MFVDRWDQIIALSLAMYGLWRVLTDVWEAFSPGRAGAPGASFLLVVKDAEEEVELMVRMLSARAHEGPGSADIVVADAGSGDATPLILERLAAEGLITFAFMPEEPRPSAAALPLCRGGIVHLIDTVHRIPRREFAAAVRGISRGEN